MLTYAFFLSNRRESLVRAFRKKTPLSVRRPGGGGGGGGGGLRGVRKVSIEKRDFFFLMASLINCQQQRVVQCMKISVGHRII